MPTFCLENEVLKRTFKVRAGDSDHPFCTSLEWSKMPPFRGMNLIKEKQGSEAILTTDSANSRPVLVYWDYGNGSSVAHLPDLTPAWGSLVMQWTYYGDYVTNLIFLSSGADIPQDQFLLHDIRQGFHNYHSKRSLTISVMEFASKFGARIHPAEEEIQDISSKYGNAEEAYLSQEYETAAEMLDEIGEDFESLEKRVLEMKDNALFWVYAIEWMVVSGALILCGSILWTLMVKRRLYREVKVTKLE